MKNRFLHFLVMSGGGAAEQSTVMDVNRIVEEKLREATCFGDEDAVRALVEKGVNINAQHEINGWTALHWAAKRGHTNILAYLLNRGADKSLLSKKGETPAALSDNEDILKLLGAPRPAAKKENPLPITPGYMAYPSINYKVDTESNPSTNKQAINGTDSPKYKYKQHSSHSQQCSDEVELVLKVRIAQSNDTDFIEVELPKNDMSYSRLLRICCEELGVDLKHVLKIRKLPDTIVRKDKDVRRLQELQELELVLTNSRQTNGIISPLANAIPGFRNCTILY